MEFFKKFIGIQTRFAFTGLTVENCVFIALLPFGEQDTFSFSLSATDLLYAVSHLNILFYLLRKACHTHCYSESYLRADLLII